MRRLTFLLLITYSSVSFGQSNKIGLGIDLGPSLKSIRTNFPHYGEDVPSYGFSVGINFQYNISKLISLKTNISFERKGQKRIDDEFLVQIGRLTVKMNYDYLTIPLLVRVNFGNKVNFFINTGLFASYLLKYQSVLEWDDGVKKEFNDSESIKKLDFGISNGVGVALPIAENLNLSLEIRNNLGLVDIFKRQDQEGDSFKTNSTNLLLGTTFIMK